MVLYFKTCCIFSLFYCNHTSLFVEHAFIFQVRHATFFVKDDGSFFPFFVSLIVTMLQNDTQIRMQQVKKKFFLIFHKNIYMFNIYKCMCSSCICSLGMSDVYPPVWNLRVVIWFPFPISSFAFLPSPLALSLLSFFILWSILLGFFPRKLSNIYL